MGPKGAHAGGKVSASEAAGKVAPVFVHYNGGSKLGKWNPEVIMYKRHL